MSLDLRPFTQNGASVLPPKTILGVNQYLQSPNGRYKLISQDDRNLALYDGASTVWIADKNSAHSDQFYPKVWKKGDTSRTYIYYKLAVFDVERRRIWNSMNTDILYGGSVKNAAGRTYLQLQDDGNMVIVDTFPLWEISSSVSVKPEVPAALIEPGTIINLGDTFTVGQSRLVFQGDGNLVFYGENGRVIWDSRTANKGATFAAMQADGQFAIYTANRVALWYTGTDGHPGAYARIQEDGSFSIVMDRVCWARFGFTPSIKPVRTMRKYVGNPYTEQWKTRDYTFWTFG